MDWSAFRAAAIAEGLWFAALMIVASMGAGAAEWVDFLWMVAPAPGPLVYSIVWFKNRYGG